MVKVRQLKHKSLWLWLKKVLTFILCLVQDANLGLCIEVRRAALLSITPTYSTPLFSSTLYKGCNAFYTGTERGIGCKLKGAESLQKNTVKAHRQTGGNGYFKFFINGIFSTHYLSSSLPPMYLPAILIPSPPRPSIPPPHSFYLFTSSLPLHL